VPYGILPSLNADDLAEPMRPLAEGCFIAADKSKVRGTLRAQSLEKAGRIVLDPLPFGASESRSIKDI
jgi:hypothetical protein